MAQRTPVSNQIGICRKCPDTNRIANSIRHVLSEGISIGYVRHQIGITFPGMTGMRRGMNNQGGADGNADIRSHRDTGIGDASGVQSEAPKGVR